MAGDRERPTAAAVEACGCQVIHRDRIDRVRAAMPGEESLYDVAELFKVFGDTTRIRILCALAESELCVCDIAALLGMTQSSISHQLRVLKQARLVRYRKEGKVVYYALDDDHVRSIFGLGLAHVGE